VRKTTFTLIAVCVLSVAAAAQIPSANVFIGYSYLRADAFSQSSSLQPVTRTANFNGWEGSLEGKFLPFIGIVADVSQTYGSGTFISSTQTVNSRVLTVAVGPRVSVHAGRFTLFAHALFGGAHITDSGAASNSDTSFATAIGGGLDYKFIKGVAWRLQGDSLHTNFFGAGQNNLRLSTGVVLRF
jgi:hypothetical protein